MKAKKFLALLLSCACIVSALTGCGDTAANSSEQSNSSGSVSTEVVSSEETTATEKEAFDPRSITEGVTLTVAAVGKPNIIDYETNLVTKKVEEALGVNLEFVTIPSADYHTKLNVMVSGGEDLPDIVLYPWNNYVNWAEEGAIIPLNEYFENPDYSKNIRKFMEENGVDFISPFTDPEGNIYKFPLNEGKLVDREYGEVGNKILIYEPWLEKLGKEVPKTMEEFYEICKLVKETDLNGNGKHDEIPLTGYKLSLSQNSANGWFDLLMNGFVYSSGLEMAYVENGKVGLSYAADEFKEGLKYIKNWMDEGLILKESITNDTAQGDALLNATEQVVFAYSAGGIAAITDLERASNYAQVSALEAPTGKTVSQYIPSVLSYNGTGASAGPVISTGCKNPLAAFLVLDYFCSEEISMINEYGEEGVNWDYWNNAKVENKADYVPTTDGYDLSIIVYNKYSKEAQNVGYTTYTCCLIPERITGGVAKLNTEPTTPEEEWQIIINQKAYKAKTEHFKYKPEEVIGYFPLTTEETEEIADIVATLTTYVPEAIGAFLTGVKDIDNDWNSYIKELENIGINELLEAYQTAYERLK